MARGRRHAPAAEPRNLPAARTRCGTRARCGTRPAMTTAGAKRWTRAPSSSITTTRPLARPSGTAQRRWAARCLPPAGTVGARPAPRASSRSKTRSSSSGRPRSRSRRRSPRTCPICRAWKTTTSSTAGTTRTGESATSSPPRRGVRWRCTPGTPRRTSERRAGATFASIGPEGAASGARSAPTITASRRTKTLAGWRRTSCTTSLDGSGTLRIATT
mmetsp:Transcript_13124/g.33515  ORF Transcript_13124/g.33515 Transcript_13124/m.33515 type:complete len:217 (+) Transcript_13124:83-733(+)